VAPQRGVFTINQAIERDNQLRREAEARRDAQWTQYRREANQKSFLKEQDQFVRSSIARSAADFKDPTADYSSAATGSDGRGIARGNSRGGTFGTVVAFVICGYALAHGVPLVTIIKIAILIAAAVAVIAIAVAVIAFIRAFAVPIIVIGCVGWYLTVHHDAPATQPVSAPHTENPVFTPADPYPAPKPASDAHLRYQAAHYVEWEEELGPARAKQIRDGLPSDLRYLPEYFNRLENAAAALHR
jgi:hypothetical protein